MKFLRALTIFGLLTGLVCAQIVNGKGTREDDSRITAISGADLTFQDALGTQSNSWEILIAGAPATMSIVVQGCMRGNTCTTLTTNTSTTSSTITTSGLYNYYKFTPTWSGGTNPTVTVNRTGTAAKNFGPGGGTVAGIAFPSTGTVAPTPAGANSCPGNPSGWVQNAAGIYETQFGVDPTQTSTSDSTFPGGLAFCRSVVFNAGAGPNPTGSGNATAFSASGVLSSTPNRHFLTQYYFANSASDATTHTTGNMGIQYGDFEINGTPTLNTTFVSTLRYRLDDNKTGGSKPRVWSVYQGETNKTALYDITNCIASGIDGFTTPCYSVFYGEQGATLPSDEDETGAVYDTFSGGTKDLGHHALNATGNVFHALVQSSTNNRFANTNGFVSDDMGTASGYYNFLSKGVAANGTASGYSALVGPITFGVQQHTAAGVQVDVENGSFTQSQTYAGTSAIENAQYTLTINPGSAMGGASDVLFLSQTSSPTQTVTGRIRGLRINDSPGGTAALTRVEALNASATGTNTATATNIAVFADAEMLNTSGTTGTNQGLRIQSGQAAAGGTITQDDAILILAPSTTGSNTHHAAIEIQQNQSVNTASNNPDGWAILLDGTADKSKFGLLFSNSICQANGSAANPSLVACGGAPTGQISCATNASAGTCVVSTTAVTANSSILLQQAVESTILTGTCNATALTEQPVVTAKSAGTSFTISLGTFATNKVCFNYWIYN